MSPSQLLPLRVVASPAPAAGPNSRASVEIYRPFFLAGVLTVLTAGCLLGALALAGIALNKSYTASAWTPYILAHANSQLYGWVGFFVMGFSLQQHAPSLAKERLFHKLAYVSLILMGLAIAVRFAAEPLVVVDRGLWMPVGIGACVTQALAVALFFLNIGLTRHRTGKGFTWQATLVFASLFWLMAVAVAEPFYFASSHAVVPQDGIPFIAEWFPPYREAQFLGFVAMMIFGVALVKMHTCFGAEEASKALGLAGFGFWTLGLLMRMGGWVYAFRYGLTGSSMLTYHLAGVALTLGAVLLIASSRMFRPLAIQCPSQKFVRGAFTWLAIGGLLMVLEPLHLALIGRPFSHAYVGAIRHAVTVGFISQMIVGVGMHVAARMKDIPPALERPLWATFWLLNLGNAARVGLEIATDYASASYLPMGATGFVELAALAIWGAYVARVMLKRIPTVSRGLA